MPKNYPFSTGYRAIFEEGTIEFDWKWRNDFPNYQIHEYCSSKGHILPKIEDKDPYYEEIKYVISAISSNRIENNIISGENMIQSLKIALAAKKSANQNGMQIELSR